MPPPEKVEVRAPGLFQGSATGPKGIRTLFAMFCLRLLAVPVLSGAVWWLLARFL